MRIAFLLPLTALALCAQSTVDREVKAFIPNLSWSKRVEPVWPRGTQGPRSEVQLLLTLDPSGAVVSAEPLTGLPAFRENALDAIRQWRFQPVIRDGQAVTAMTTETLLFLNPGQSVDKVPTPPDEMRRALQRISELTSRFPRSARQVLADLEQSLNGAPPIDREMQLPALAKAAIRAEDIPKAISFGNELLASQHTWGGGVHDGNLILGLVALKNGDIINARLRLLKAGESTGSPVLSSFGPNMTLAKALLEAGERDVVLQYFDECRSFWRLGANKLDEWSAVVRDGGMPDFGPNLLY